MKIRLGMGQWNMQAVSDVLGGCMQGEDRTFSCVTHDSREADGECLYIALHGEKTDGNRFVGRIPDVNCYLSETQLPSSSLSCNVCVAHTDQALMQLGKAYRNAYLPNLRVFAVTGSVGKTTTKELIASVLRVRYADLAKSQANHNSVIGLPLTLLSIAPDTAAAVLEMGMSARGEIESMSVCARPQVAVITNVGTSHMGCLGTRDAIASAKWEISKGISDGGTLFWNGDEPLLRVRAVGHYPFHMVSFGFGQDCDYRAVDVGYAEGTMTFRVRTPEGRVTDRFIVPGIGKHLVADGLVAVAVALREGMGDAEIAEGLSSYRTVGMRQNLMACGSYRVLADCYNASPESMVTAAETVTLLTEERKEDAAAIVGDMLELGDAAEELHVAAGKTLARAGIRYLYCIGEYAEAFRRGAIDGGADAARIVTESVSGKDACIRAAEWVLSAIPHGGTVLVKASRAMHFEDAVDAFSMLTEEQNKKETNGCQSQ